MRKKIFVPIISFLIFVPTVYLYYNYALNLPNSSDEATVDFNIESGQGVEEIAQNLYQKGLIRSAALFQLYTALSDLSDKLQAGEYQIPQNLNTKEVPELLQHGKFEEKLTFIEGWRREEMAEYINKQKTKNNEQLTGDDFLRETEGIEGYLFPDTYFISRETTAEELVKMMRENFGNRIKRDEEGLKRIGISFEEAVIIASIIEREASAAEDKPIVAGILIKRYLNDWPLQVDATIQYALGYQTAGKTLWKKNLTEDDLEIDSPYNTYKHPGLPPTPICNPGLDSLEAALNPEETDYWYYLSDSEGKMHYSITNDEHNESVVEYVR